MRAAELFLLLALTVAVNSCRHTDAGSTAASARPEATTVASQQAGTASKSSVSGDDRVDFDTEVKPILEARCQPCHFPGGIMYERRPFDRPETIMALGTKLFTRLKDEHDRQIVSQFLTQQTPTQPQQPPN